MRSDRIRAGDESGLSTLEVLAAATLALVVAIASYQFLESARYTFAVQTGLATAQSSGRTVMDVLAGNARVAGLSPLGARFPAIPSGDGFRVRLLADLDGDGVVGGASEPGEDLVWAFRDTDGDQVFDLVRGIDLDGDWEFGGTGESFEVAATHLVRVDANGDGTAEPFFSYDAAPPAATRLFVTYGSRVAKRDAFRKTWQVVPFRAEVALWNRVRIDDPAHLACGNL